MGSTSNETMKRSSTDSQYSIARTNVAYQATARAGYADSPPEAFRPGGRGRGRPARSRIGVDADHAALAIDVDDDASANLSCDDVFSRAQRLVPGRSRC